MSQALDTAAPVPRVSVGRSDRLAIGEGVAGGIILAALIAAGAALPVAAVLVLGVATLIGVQSWRLSVFLALAYLPVEGVLWVALYPHTAPAALAKDFLFVIPAYIGFFYWYMKSKRNFVFPGFPAPGGGPARGTGHRRDLQSAARALLGASSGRRSGSSTYRWRSSVTT